MQKEIAWVIGASSFIGKHLVTHLEEQGMEVIQAGRKEMEGKLGPKVPEHFDYLFNLAAAGSKSGTYSDWEMFWTNTHQVYELLDATKDINYKAFVQFSTSSVYGNKESPMREDDNLDPNFIYASTKAAGDMLCLGHAHFYNKPIFLVRPFTVYGPGMQDTKLIPVLIKKIRSGEPVTIVEGVHDYIYIADLLDGIDKVIHNVDKIQGHVVNIGSGRQNTNLDVLRRVEELVGKHAVISDKKVLHGHKHYKIDSDVWVANCNSLKALGWRPSVSLDYGLRLTIKSYEK